MVLYEETARLLEDRMAIALERHIERAIREEERKVREQSILEEREEKQIEKQQKQVVERRQIKLEIQAKAEEAVQRRQKVSQHQEKKQQKMYEEEAMKLERAEERRALVEKRKQERIEKTSAMSEEKQQRAHKAKLELERREALRKTGIVQKMQVHEDRRRQAEEKRLHELQLQHVAEEEQMQAARLKREAFRRKEEAKRQATERQVYEKMHRTDHFVDEKQQMIDRLARIHKEAKEKRAHVQTIVEKYSQKGNIEGLRSAVRALYESRSDLSQGHRYSAVASSSSAPSLYPSYPADPAASKRPGANGALARGSDRTFEPPSRVHLNAQRELRSGRAEFWTKLQGDKSSRLLAVDNSSDYLSLEDGQ